MCPLYPVKHRETGEEKEIKLTLSEWEEWKKENPDWFRFFTPENTNFTSTESVGDWRGKLYKSHPGWKDVMGKVKKAGKRNPSITQQY